MIKSNIKTTTYILEHDFRIDIQEANMLYNVWLYNDTIGIKDFMFCLPKENTTYEDLLKIIENNLKNESYIYDYYKQYMPYEEELEEIFNA